MQPDLSFLFADTSGDELNGSYIKGKLDTTGNASGVIHISFEADVEYTHYSCPFDTEWTAKRGS